jgi:HK97 family phage major capsid protein
MDLNKLHEVKSELLARARSIPGRAIAAGRGATTEEKGEVESLLTKIKVLNEQINFELEVADLEGKRRDQEVAETVKPSRGKSYRQLFGSAGSRDRAGFSSFDEFLKSIHLGIGDRRLLASGGMQEKIPSEGGFLVPSEYAGLLMDRSLENEIVRPRATVYPMQTDNLRIAALDGEDRSGQTVYGYSGQWLSELEPAFEEQPKIREINLITKKLAAFTSASNELIADAPSFEAVLGNAMQKAISYHLDRAFLLGDGAGKPLGILADPALIVAAKEAGQAAATLTYTNVVAMFSRLAPSFQAGAVWIASASAMPQLMQLGVVVGTGGSHVAVLQEASGKFTLLGKEILFSEHLPALGNQGDIILADLSAYAIGLRREVSVDRSNAPKWFSDATSYRCIVRVDGSGLTPGPITLAGGATQSWAVTLQARS